MAGGSCTATAKAKENAQATATCGTVGGSVNAQATKGGIAVGSDNAPPTCTPNGGTAKVRSSAGNCG